MTSTKPKITIYTDGACSGNPGPMGIGILLVSGKHMKQTYKYLGTGTNNIAELTAILEALKAIKDPSREIELFTDSAYCIGLFTKGWKAKKNTELVNEIKTLLKKFPKLTFKKVKGHSDNWGNNKADSLAVYAITAKTDYSTYTTMEQEDKDAFNNSKI